MVLTRGAYAGAVTEVVAYTDGGPRFLTVRPASFPALKEGGSAGVAPVEVEAGELEAATSAPAGTTWISDTPSTSARPDLGAAKAVVAGGRALGDAASFTALGALADRLGGALGATRAAVDGGLAPNELQVGQTGRIVAPTLYIAVGISGASQHVAGMKDAGCIVAINTDADAPIFQIADYGWVADWKTAIPALEAELEKAGVTGAGGGK